MNARPHEPDPRLSEYLDGELSGSEAREVEAHLEGCGECREALSGLEAVRERARTLEDRGPEVDLWPAILEAVERPTVIDLQDRRRRRRAAEAVKRHRRGVFLSLPQLAGAAAVLAAVAAGGAWAMARVSAGGAGPEAIAEVPVPEGAMPAAAVSEDVPFSEHADEVARLQEALEQGRERLDPNTVRILEKNLALIDQAIRESVEALAVDPGNPFVEEHLRRSWERKVTYLREATALLDMAD